ncbi:hypothetical protein [Streptomyces sp. NPDC090036]|uniref:hypothetical protein n=1 Tax=Streptomyces sp. NPDC090036 TaxID=3365926 RepID=UPI00382D2579
MELVAQTRPVPSGARTLLLCRLLEWLPDEDAVLSLTEAAATLPADGALVLVEQVEAADPDDIDAALHHLRLTAAFGSGLRSVKDVTVLAERAGLVVRDCRDVGWDHRLWVLGPTAVPGRAGPGRGPYALSPPRAQAFAEAADARWAAMGVGPAPGQWPRAGRPPLGHQCRVRGTRGA